MQPNDDERFEQFLRQFRPRAPEPLPTERPQHTSKRRFVFAGSTVAAAFILMIVLTVTLAITRHFQPHTSDNTGRLGGERLPEPRTLTIGRANALLAQQPSVKAVIDNMTFRFQSPQPSKSMQSALAVLGKEKIEL